ncbi:SMP-30/gluconolactonase/LRE family protein [Stigmatella erecta]|uniref:SMP-30/Gluconolaconase/LRE-like region-containing protein n=1 Tax=Stigmatella erecta TaxID=83460 RepID=A0A1I0JKI2_9BACT|nr:hypothetical protein [Stigmatella erecta]SEU10817.1 hypothetical protein SAMN05443639_107373 [Stigmatella erecta]
MVGGHFGDLKKKGITFGGPECTPGYYNNEGIKTTYRQEVVVPGSAFQGVHGLALDGKGHLLASNLLGQSVHSIDLSTGAVTTVEEPPLGGADDVTFGPDGSLYWTGFFTGQLMRRTPEGTTRVIATELPGLNSLAFRRDGRFYVTQVGRGDALWEVAPDGNTPPQLLLSGLGTLNGCTWRMCTPFAG